MGTDRYPSDAQMALVYRAACPDSLYPRVKMKWAYKSGSLCEIQTLLELEVSKYMANKHDSPTVSRGKVPATMPNSSTLAHPVSHYHDPKTPLPYYLSPAGKYIRKSYVKKESKIVPDKKVQLDLREKNWTSSWTSSWTSN
ncbi:hypothetical protein AYX14_07098 [Cryptococcus neoformans]|nr:hypothetical protein AYX14_07098 [Cryptococcus neoformans var. grubii]